MTTRLTSLIARAELALQEDLASVRIESGHAANLLCRRLGAEAVTRGSTQDEQISNATTAANAFFAANYPQGFLGSTATLSAPSVNINKGTVTIDLGSTLDLISATIDQDDVVYPCKGCGEILEEGKAFVRTRPVTPPAIY